MIPGGSNHPFKRFGRVGDLFARSFPLTMAGKVDRARMVLVALLFNRRFSLGCLLEIQNRLIGGDLQECELDFGEFAGSINADFVVMWG